MTANPKFPAGDWRGKSPDFRGDALHIAVVDRLRALAERRGHSLAHLAIAWTLAVPGVHVAIVGSHTPEQIAGTVGAVELELTSGDLAEVEAIMKDAVSLVGPSPEAMPDERTDMAISTRGAAPLMQPTVSGRRQTEAPVNRSTFR